MQLYLTFISSSNFHPLFSLTSFYIGLPRLVDLRAMESDKTRVLRIVRDTELAHPGLYLVEAFLNDAVDGDQAARYLLQRYADNGSDINFHQFVKDWKELVRLCKFYPQH